MNRRAWLFLMSGAAAPLSGQAPPAVSLSRPAPRVTLSLGEALSRARVSSPTYRQALNDAGPARWAVRNAYGQLVPQVNVGGSLGYAGSGQSQFGGSLFNQTSPSLTSGYGVEMSMTLNGTVLTGPATQRASQRAVDADITSAARSLDNEITIQYLITLQATAQTDVSRQQIIRNRDFLELAQARFQVGSGTLLDVRQAEVTHGQSELTALRAEQTENEAKLELLRRMGVELPVPVAELGLSDSFPVSSPQWDLEQLLRMADEENPSLRAAKAREDAATWSVRAARSEYLPSLSFFASWNGFTQEFTDGGLLVDQATGRAIQNAANCEFQNALIRQLPGGGIPGYDNGGLVPDCRAFAGLDATGQALLPENRSLIVNQNNVWPFSFTGQPFQASLRVSIPIFTGFSRHLQVSRANAQREDAEEALRGNRLQVRSAVHARFLEVQTSHRAIAVQEGNQRAAREQLELARERFRLGAGSSLEVSDAQAAIARAEADYVNAVYAYHRAIAVLEFAVGRSLR